jgi:hypothetical protein
VNKLNSWAYALGHLSQAPRRVQKKPPHIISTIVVLREILDIVARLGICDNSVIELFQAQRPLGEE